MITFFYNEEDEMGDYLETVAKKFEIMAEKLDFEYEMVMVDDGSTDRSKKIVEAFTEQHKDIKIILHSYPVNKGIGNALVEGLRLCNNDYVFWNDVDMHFDILDMDKILPHLDDKTIVVAYKDSLMYKKRASWIVSRTNYYLLKFIFYPSIRDFQFVQFYPREYVQHAKIISRSSLIPCELLTRSKGVKSVTQVPLHYYSPPHRRKSKCLNAKNVAFTLRDISRLKFKMIQESVDKVMRKT